jgi:predicted DNA-binding transcriptional regulator YafY
MDIRWDEMTRFRLIELVALWEGRLTTNHLTDFFDIGRDKASKDIKHYMAHCPENLIYDTSLKGYKPAATFKPQMTKGLLDEYQQLVASDLSGTATGFNAIHAPIRNITPKLVQPILRACRENLRIDIGYISLSNPDYQDRIIAPHALVYDGLRWHVRAFCCKNQDYRDFVLSRFSGDAAFEGKSQQTAEQDDNWQTIVDIVIQPDPRLSEQNKQLIELDYQMENGLRTLKCRAALVMYLLKRLRLDISQTSGEAQQIILQPDCQKRIAEYLP